jgi:plasmid maintenance system killer protein
MQRFILRQNTQHFQRTLEAETNEASRRTLHALMAAARRKLAFLEAAAKGAELGQPFALLRTALRDDGHLEQLHRMLAAEAGPCMLLDPGPGLHIVGINSAYAAATMTAPADLGKF